MSQQEGLGPTLAKLSHVRLDEDAWVELFRQARPFVLGVVYRALNGRNLNLAPDIAQEVFLALLRYTDFQKLTTDAEFRAYATTVARREAKKAQMRLVRTPEESIDDVADSAEPRVAPQTWKAELEELLQEETVSLKPEERRLLGLLAAGASLKEAGQALSISAKAASVRISRLRAKLRGTALHKYLAGSPDAEP